MSYTIAATENETLKISNVEATSKKKLSADLGLVIPGLEGTKLDLSPSNESTIKTTSDVTSQYERLGVDIMPDLLRIVRESGPGGNVVGNTTVALSMKTDPYQISKGSDLPVRKREIQLVVTEIQLNDANPTPTMTVLPLVPLPHCAFRASVSAVYEQRHVKSGSMYYDEAQQDAFFIHDVMAAQPVEIMGADEVSPFVWSIQIVPAQDQPDKPGVHEVLTAQFKDQGLPRKLIFSDYGRAVKVAHWVRTNPGKTVSDYHFNWPNDGETGLAVVKYTDDDCKKITGLQARIRPGSGSRITQVSE